MALARSGSGLRHRRADPHADRAIALRSRVRRANRWSAGSHVGGTHLLMARVLLWLVRITATLAVLCLLLALGAIWYGHTEGALERAVAEAIARSGGRLQVE